MDKSQNADKHLSFTGGRAAALSGEATQILGKDEVSSSNLLISSIKTHRDF